MNLDKKKLIESYEEWFDYYKELINLHDSVGYFGPEDDCRECYTNPYYRPIRYPVIVTGHNYHDREDGDVFMFTFTYLNDFF